MLSTFRALKPSESDSKAQFLKCLSHLRKALASCDHDCYVIRVPSACMHPLGPRSLQRTVTCLWLI